MRRLFAIATVGLLGLAACTDSSTSGGAPTGLPQANDVIPPPPCISIDSTRALVRAVYPAGAKQTSAQNALSLIKSRMAAGNAPGAQEAALILTRTILTDYYAGQLLGGTSAATQKNTRDLINGIFCLAGLPQPNVSLDPDGVSGVVGPTTGTATLVTPTKYAGITVPGGAAPQLTLITVRRLPDAPGPLFTPLDQYPAYYEYEAVPATAFSTDLLVGVCQVQDFTPPDYSRLRIGHNVGTGIEILPRVAAPFLDCSTLIGAAPFYPGLKGYAARGWHWVTRMALPTPAYAAVGNCCLGGTTKSFSPFGAVDTLTILTLDTPLIISGPPGSAVSINDLPRVFLRTPQGKPVPGAGVTFTLNAGSDATIAGTMRTTSSRGVAELGSWTLGTDNRPDTVYVTVTPLANTEVQGNGQYYVAP